MKRVLLTITGTVLGLVALLSFKTHGHPLAAANLPSAGLPGASAGATSQTTTSAPPKPGSHPTSSAGAASVHTVNGAAVDTPYGIVQVQVSVQGHKITNVKFLQLTAYDGRSAEINNAAAPILLQQTLSVQSSQIDGVSGASYTSAGYQQSLQSALDQVGIR